MSYPRTNFSCSCGCGCGSSCRPQTNPLDTYISSLLSSVADLSGRTNALSTDLATTKAGLSVNFFQFVPVAKIASIRARTNTENLSPYFALALASGFREVHLEPGLYNVSSAIPLSVTGQAITGAGSDRTEIRINSTTLPAITLANGVAGYRIEGFKISRAGTPGPAAHGIQFLGTTDSSRLENLEIVDNFHNLIIGTCDTGLIRNVVCRRALGHNVLQSCSATYGPSQWEVDNVLCERAAVDDWHIEATPGSPGMILGTMRSYKSFASTGRGLHVIGTSTTPVYDLRLTDAFIGSNNAGCIRLDTYGGSHSIQGFFERAGADPSGPTLSTAASGQGAGIEISGNNQDVDVSVSRLIGNTLDGILHNGGTLTATGNVITNNGQSLTGGRRNGVLSQGGTLIMSGGRNTNDTGNTTQLYGIATSHGNVNLTGIHMPSNTTAPIALGSVTNAVVSAISPAGITPTRP